MAIVQVNVFPGVDLELLGFQYNSVSDVRLRVYDVGFIMEDEDESQFTYPVMNRSI